MRRMSGFVNLVVLFTLLAHSVSAFKFPVNVITGRISCTSLLAQTKVLLCLCKLSHDARICLFLNIPYFTADQREAFNCVAYA